MNIHYTENYLLNPPNIITVNLIGAGGTGSMILSGLARLNEALIGLGHKGIKVTVYDPDIVTEANIGRQLFSPADIGLSKAMVLVTRINRYFGYGWDARQCIYEVKKSQYANILITAVDTKEVRLKLHKTFRKKYYLDPTDWNVNHQPVYWLDLGNTSDKGQVVLSTLCSVKQPKSEHTTFEKLKTIIDIFPNYRKIKDDNTPSCSLAEALSKQDLFINSTIAQYGLDLIWKLFRQGYLTHHGAFINLDNFKTNPIMI
jgi:PRTRC genetic system ThiF family protein